MEDETDDEEGKGHGTEDDDEESDTGNTGIEGFTKRWVWLDYAVRVREIYGCTLDKVYELNLIEFFNYISYIREKQELEAEEIKKIKNRMK